MGSGSGSGEYFTVSETEKSVIGGKVKRSVKTWGGVEWDYMYQSSCMGKEEKKRKETGEEGENTADDS